MEQSSDLSTRQRARSLDYVWPNTRTLVLSPQRPRDPGSEPFALVDVFQVPLETCNKKIFTQPKLGSPLMCHQSSTLLGFCISARPTCARATGSQPQAGSQTHLVGAPVAGAATQRRRAAPPPCQRPSLQSCASTFVLQHKIEMRHVTHITHQV